MESWETAHANPKNWPLWKRRATTLMASLFMLVSPVSSSIVAPALPTLQREFDIASEPTTQMILSVFVLSSAIGPLVVSPLSEVYGRQPVLHATMFLFSVFNLACAFSKTATQLLVFRFLAGIGGSAPAIGPGILGDCWRSEERGKSLRSYYIFTLLGPAIGPIVGGFIVRYLHWRWMFYTTTILSAFIQLVGLAVFQETYPPIIIGNIQSRREHSDQRDEYRRVDPWKVLFQALVRPLRLIGTQFVIQLLALYTAFLYGLLYFVLSTYVLVFTGLYHEPPEIATLNYASLAVGFTAGTQIMALICDHVSQWMKKSPFLIRRLSSTRYT